MNPRPANHKYPKTRFEVEKYPEVRVRNSAGPCLRRYQIRENRDTITVAYSGSSVPDSNVVLFERRYPGEVHTEPCERCADHPKTIYPTGCET